VPQSSQTLKKRRGRGPTGEPLDKRILRLTDRSGECWLWLGRKNPKGYGQMTIAKHQRSAHRVSYETFVGPIPEGLEIDHLCRVRHCVNPGHLEAVTRSVNLRRQMAATGMVGGKLIGRPSTLPAVFRAAARLLTANGHYQGDYCPDPFDRRTQTPHAERPLSIVAAIRCVASPGGDNPHRITELSEAAVKVLAGRLEVDGEPAWNEEPHHLEGHVANWGDVEGRRVESVVAVLEAAADACEVAA